MHYLDLEFFPSICLAYFKVAHCHLYSCQIISTLLRPRNWKAPANRRFFLDSYEVGELCYAAEQIFMHEPTVLQLKAPVKVFGDLHGQFGDLMRLFDEYGFPSTAGDIT
jgi:protein phosphatase